MSVFIPNAASSLSQAYAGAAEPASYTVMLWVNLGTNPGTYRQFFFVSPSSLGLSTNADGVTVDYGSNSANFTGQVLTADTWYLLCQVVVGSTASLHYIYGYLNGEIVVTGTDTSTYSAATNLFLGNSSAGGGNPLSGQIRDVRFWNRALNGQEVQDEFDSGVPRHRGGLVLWSPFDDDLYTDRTGNGNVWTTTGAGIVNQNSGPRKAWPGRGMNFIR